MAFSIGTKIVRIASVWEGSIETQVIVHETVTKIGKSTGTECIWVNHQHKPEDCLYAVYAYPDIPECVEFLQRTLDLAEKHKKEDAELMTDTYKLNNKLVLAGLK